MENNIRSNILEQMKRLNWKGRMNFVQIFVWLSGNILCCWLENQRSNIGKVNKMKKVYKNYRRNTHTHNTCF